MQRLCGAEAHTRDSWAKETASQRLRPRKKQSLRTSPKTAELREPAENALKPETTTTSRIAEETQARRAGDGGQQQGKESDSDGQTGPRSCEPHSPESKATSNKETRKEPNTQVGSRSRT